MSTSQFINCSSACIKTASLRYLDEITKLKCGPDLLALGIFPNAKEITESFAAFNSVRRQISSKLCDENGMCIVIGDGVSPRTGAVTVYRSRWNVYSVDPSMRMNTLRATSQNPAIHRLHRIPKRIEDAWGDLKEPASKASFVVILAVHSHAPLEMPSWLDPELVIAIPCCVPQSLGRQTSFTYEDWGIHSPKRKVHVWRKQAV